MTRVLQSPWLAVALAVLAYAATTLVLLRPGTLQVALPTTPTGTSTPKVEPLLPSWGFKNPELDQLVSELRSERLALKSRAQELDDLASRLALERQEIGSVTQRVAFLQAEIDTNFVRIKAEETSNLKRLAKIYASMAPEAAAKILAEFQDEAAVKILAFMKESETAPILEGLAKDGPIAARRVALLSDRLRLLSASPPAAPPTAP